MIEVNTLGLMRGENFQVVVAEAEDENFDLEKISTEIQKKTKDSVFALEVLTLEPGEAVWFRQSNGVSIAVVHERYLLLNSSHNFHLAWRRLGFLAGFAGSAEEKSARKKVAEETKPKRLLG